MSDGGLDPRTFAEQVSFLSLFVIGICGLRYVREQYLRAFVFFLAAVASVFRQPFQRLSVDAFDLLEALVYRVAVILVAECQDAEEESRQRAHHRHLVAELVFLVLLVLVDALLLGLVDGVDLALVIAFLVDTLMKMLICSS